MNRHEELTRRLRAEIGREPQATDEVWQEIRRRANYVDIDPSPGRSPDGRRIRVLVVGVAAALLVAAGGVWLSAGMSGNAGDEAARAGPVDTSRTGPGRPHDPTEASEGSGAGAHGSVPGSTPPSGHGLIETPGSLSRLLLTRPALAAERWVEPPTRLDAMFRWPGAELLSGRVTRIEVVASETELDGLDASSANVHYRITLEGEWIDVQTGISRRDRQLWVINAWAGPSDSLPGVLEDLRGRASEVGPKEVVLIAVPTSERSQVDVRLGLVEEDHSGAAVAPLTVGGAGAFDGFGSLEDARFAVEELIGTAQPDRPSS